MVAQPSQEYTSWAARLILLSSAFNRWACMMRQAFTSWASSPGAHIHSRQPCVLALPDFYAHACLTYMESWVCAGVRRALEPKYIYVHMCMYILIYIYLDIHIHKHINLHTQAHIHIPWHCVLAHVGLLALFLCMADCI